MPVEYGTDALGAGINLAPMKNQSNFLNTSYEFGSFNAHRVTFNTGREVGSRSHISIQSFGNYFDNDYIMKGTVNRVFRTNANGFVQPDIETIDARRFCDRNYSFSTTLTGRFWDLSWADDLKVSSLYNDRSDVFAFLLAIINLFPATL